MGSDRFLYFKSLFIVFAIRSRALIFNFLERLIRVLFILFNRIDLVASCVCVCVCVVNLVYRHYFGLNL